MTDAATIAGSLSVAQRRLLVRLVDSGSTHSAGTDLRTVNALDRLGLTGASYDRHTFDETVFPTVLGHSVRQHLKGRGS